MIPSYIMKIERIPVTPSGKVNRRALPDIEFKLSGEYVAPTNEKERVICETFCNILDLKRVGIKDNFFELGGDSIKALRIISLLRTKGYHVTVKDIMNRKTVEKIATVLKEEHETLHYEQGEVSGTVKKTPIIQLFDAWNLVNPAHFNQAMMFPVDGIEIPVIKKAIETLVKHHDVLRGVYQNEELTILPIAESKLYDLYEYDYRKTADVVHAISEECTKIQGSINLEDGPFVKIAVFTTDDTKVMMFCIHHLVVDGVSWRILAEDFKTAVEQIIKGEEVKLPEKTASFIEWSNLLEEYSNRLSEKEKLYWEQIDARIIYAKINNASAKEDKDCSVVDSKVRYVSQLDFSKEFTEKILKQASSICGAKVNEVLLSGIARTIGQMTGQEKIAINLESHGREKLHKTIDIDRTVGWFTNIYPVILDCTQDIRHSVIGAKEAVRSVPNGGIGYGCHMTSKERNQSDISFNYLGELDEVGTQENYNCGDNFATENATDDLILINGMTSHGKMQFIIVSQDERFDQNFIDDFTNCFEKAMKEIIEYCSESSQVEKTASDYELYDISVDEFEYLQNEFEGEVNKIYELTPLQEGMLFHNVVDTSSTAYVLQTVLNIDTEMESERVKQALHLLSLRYEVLRTAIIYENVVEPKQVIYQEREPEFHVLDFSTFSVEDKKQALDDLIQEDVIRGFHLQSDSLLRVTFVKYGEKNIKLIWSMHHIIVDGWCLQALMSKFMEYYYRLDQGAFYDNIVRSIKEEVYSQGTYSDYIYWIRRQDQSTAKEYWRSLLCDYENDCELRPMATPMQCKDQMRRCSIQLNEDVTSQLKKYAKDQEITLSTIVETICGLVLQRYTGSNDVVFGKVVSGRNAEIPGIEKMVGLFINTIPVRVHVKKNMLVKDLIKEQQKQSNESTNHDYISLAEIQNQTIQGNELIKVLYVFENYSSGLQTENEDVLNQFISVEQTREQTNYDITISAYESDGKLEYALMYQPNRYVEEEMMLLLKRLVQVSKEIAISLDKHVEEIDSITKEEQEIILNSFDAADVDYPREKTVLALFEEQVEKNRDKTAIVFNNKKIKIKS